MEWLPGVLVGGVVGFISALGSTLIVTEYKAWRERGRRKTDLVEMLHTEVTINRQGLQDAVKTASRLVKTRRFIRQAGPQFSREVYRGCVSELALLPRSSRYKVQNFYACLDDMELIVSEAQSWPILDVRTKRYLQTRLLQRGRLALKRGDEVLSELGKLG